MKFSSSLKSFIIAVALLCLLASNLCIAQGDKAGSAIPKETKNNVSIDQEAYDIGLQAYLYFYPLVTMEVTRRQATDGEAGNGSGPMNEFHHIRAQGKY